MKRTLLLSAAILLACMFSLSCAYSASPVTGAIYTEVKAPVTATSVESTGTLKVGEASCESFLGLIAVGDCSIEAAARDAGITTVHHVDYRATGVLGLYARFTVLVYGE